MLSLLNIKQCQSCAAARKRAQVAAIDLGEEDMADSTKEEEKLHRKVRKLFQKWEKKEEKKTCICHANFHRHTNIYIDTKENKHNHLASGLRETVLHLCTATPVVRNGFELVMKNFKSKEPVWSG